MAQKKGDEIGLWKIEHKPVLTQMCWHKATQSIKAASGGADLQLASILVN